MSLRRPLRIALIAGGTSSEREVSLKGAEAVKRALNALGHEVIFFDPATDLEKLVRRAGEIDFAFLVIHGPGGEDGTLQGFLDMLRIPYQGAGVLGSALAMHKGLSKILYQRAGLPVPRGFLFHRERFKSEDLMEAVTELGYPVIVKPVRQGSSVGLSLVRDGKDLREAVDRAFSVDCEILIEEYIPGRELTVGILGREVLPVVEIIPTSEVFDYENKYTPGKAKEVCPAELPHELTAKAQRYALLAHQALYLRHYSRTDMILRGEEIYVLETNTIPGMTETSLLPLSAKVAGYTFERLIERLIELALSERD